MNPLLLERTLTIQNNQRIVTFIWEKGIPSSFYLDTFHKKNFLVLILLDCNFEPNLTTLKNFNKQGTKT